MNNYDTKVINPYNLCDKDMDEVTVRSRGIIINSFKDILMCYSNGMKHYEFPGGHLEKNESINEDNKFNDNILALEQVQPTPLDFDEISVKLGSTWIPEDIYHQFCVELLDIPRCNASVLKVKYAKEANTWLFQASGLYGYGVKNTNTWGTDRADALSIIKNTLNLQTVTVYDKLDDDRRVVNPVETANAREKQELIKQEFKEWLWKDEER